MGATDSKLAFRKGVFRLFEERNVPKSADDYWTLFWTLPESVDDVYTLIGATDIRKARDGARENLETLIDKLLEQMDSLLNTTAPTVQATPLLNCCRVLTRIMPFIFESPECSEWEERFFWSPRVVETDPNQSPPDQKNTAQYNTLPPRGEKLISMTLQALFLSGFTLPQSMGTVDSKINFVIWETGVGSSTPIGSSRDNDIHRTEVLRLLIVLFSKSMYYTPSTVLNKPDRWLHYMMVKSERKIILAFLCSMLNTSCKFNPMGWTAVPYNHIVYTDPREQLVALCIRVLLIVLDYQTPYVTKYQNEGSSHDPDASSSSAKIDVITEDMEKTRISENHVETMDNAFRYYLSKLHRAQDFQFLIDGIYRILSSPMQTLNTYLPGSLKKARYHVEMMMLCWKLLEVNSRFRSYLMETERALDLMIVLLFYASENKLDQSQVGLVRMCSFILQTLSSDRSFSNILNKSFEGHASLPVNIRIPNFQGTYADFLILTIFSLIASSKGALSTLYPALIKTITNISPYLKNLSQLSCSKLLALFSSMSAPGFLLADEANHFLVEYLVEAFNNTIHFQYENNPHLVYAILRNHQKFEKLAEFSLDNALIEIERARQAKENKLLQQQRQALDEGNTGLSEKAKGKLREDTLSRASSSSSIHSTSTLSQRQPSISSLSSISSLLPGAKNGFIPTDDWIYQWHSRLPLETISALIDEFLPRLEPDMTTEQVYDMLRNTSSANILPPAQPILIRKFQWLEPLVIWFHSMLWGQTYVSSVSNYGPWNNTHIKLFHIKQQKSQVEDTPSSPRNSFSAKAPSSS